MSAALFLDTQEIGRRRAAAAVATGVKNRQWLRAHSIVVGESAVALALLMTPAAWKWPDAR